MKTRHILLVEDDHRLSESISRTLVRKGFNVTAIPDGAEGLAQALSQAFDLVILDVVLPGMDGYAICRQLRAQKPRLPILMLTALDDTEDRLKGFEQGTDDYMAKPFDIRELYARIQALLRRNEFIDDFRMQTVLKVADLEMNLLAKSVSRSGNKLELTAREYALLEYMLLHQNKLITKAELLKEVWGLNFDPGTNIVEVYIAYLRKKVDRNFEPKLIHTKPGQGYQVKPT
ncbi:response regulator transcription factor [Siphonobacter aquaeclarae]|jgi:two-component system copper resistance phosphate regulon response regulator CusR|uniref:DNA-binding response regulator, OmpR family, contains REC and winged-helix (WHTH) domain n=1 Tax=Siphonobacter aquaeclarae TaxID=563176 RepID=A0A1G9MIV6_9BACT|nr:response regulator transcription factor [Siphonobacter aquaeclarae]MBO9638002.1 response regulator transcription factor [Siphonobacter aquaeclarae]SDL73941.1 DNA-binding response regulator, OmpR family, contains REC and winged-helix (wHTH) domain [Siphonobacter aquaeclarae]